MLSRGRFPPLGTLGGRAGNTTRMGKPKFEANSDSSWIRASLSDPQRFATIFERHAEAVHRYLARRVQRQAVDDLLAESFVIAFRTRGTYKHAYLDARPWLFGIATNVVHHHRRSEGRRLAMVRRVRQGISPDDALVDVADDVVSRHELEDQFELVRSALSQVDEKYLDVLTLFTGPQLSYEEISRALGIPVGTVRSRLSRARTHLRELLEATGQYQDDEVPLTLRSIAEEEHPQ
jgi:RNA polymerase sigma factor (sigma-70 family)